ncbi:fimbrial protein [Pseudomonas sp. IB20]|uniref:fimbrial protein n=1 Tax=Pseudomonas TaxID=286 RepID=UPI000BA0AA21|nr:MULTISPECIES: fimbrial protein [unclassified Pseudomonas]MCV2228670.1 type 1 fimbrial protein [Pseudomonas sp. AU10]OZO01099.1 fimbrial protein [Pseudomonas sp. IB20]
MKKTLVSTALAAGAFFVVMAPAAHAADGTMNFTGNITANTCVINASAPNLTVALGNVPASSLASSGQRAGQTPFQMSLTACSDGSTRVAAKFESGLVDSATGHLRLDATSTATNVQIAVYDTTDTDNKFGQAPTASAYQTLVGNAATLNYNAWYVATGAATVGTANSNATYTLSYQ